MQCFGGGIQAVFVQKCDEALPRHLPEPPHKVAGAAGADLSGIRHPEFFGIVRGKPLQNRFQPPGVGGLCGKLLLSLRNQQGQKAQQFALDDQLIAGAFGTVGIFHFPQAGGSGKIAQVVGGQMSGQRQPPALQREQILFRAEISRAAQKFQFKDDILILHGLPLSLPQGVEGPGGKHKDIPHAGRVSHRPHLHQPRPPLDEHQFHAVVPVQGHLREISRDGAGVNVEREPHSSVLLGFLQRSRILHRLTS